MQNFLKKVWNIFKQKYGQILLVLLLLIVCIVSIKSGKYLLSNDNYSPELNPLMSTERYLQSPAWRGYRVLGFASDSEQADIFRSIFFTILTPLFGGQNLGQMYYLLCLSIGAISMAALVSGFVKDSKLRRYSQISFLFSGVIYITTLWTMWLFYQTMAPYIANYAFFPLLLLFAYRYMKEPSVQRLFLFFLSSIAFTSVNVIATLFIIDAIVFFLFLVMVGLSLKRTFGGVAGRVFKLLLIFGITQLFWILPFLHYTVVNSQDIMDSYVNKTITTSTIDLESEAETPMNAARFYNRNLTEMEDNKYVFPMGMEFQTYDFYKVIGFMPAFLSILALVFGLFRKHKKLFFWGALALGSWFLIKVTNPPFGSLFTWMQEYIPLFKQVLRWPFSKLGEIFLISLTVLSTFGFIYLTSFLASFFKENSRKFFKSTFFLVTILLSLIYAEYMFRGSLFPERALVTVPDDYYQLKEYLEDNDMQGRIYYAPPSNNNYFRKYDWGFWGSQFISYILPNPTMDMSLAVGSSFGENALWAMADSFRAGDKEKFDLLLQKYDVKYLLFDKSINLEGFSFDLDLERSMTLLEGYTPIWNSEILNLYEVPKKINIPYMETYGEKVTSDNNYFVREIPDVPVISLSNIQPNIIGTEGNDILTELNYNGRSLFLKSNIEQEKLLQSPSRLELSGGTVKATPSYPKLSSDRSILPFKEFELINSEQYFVVNDIVYTREDLKQGITVEETYSNLENIYITGEEAGTVNLLPSLEKSLGGDCSGDNIVHNTSVEGEKVATGLRVKGSSVLPCIYTFINQLNPESKYVIKLHFNWEAINDNYAGYCLMSQKEGKCLNREKFFDSQNGFGNNTVLLKEVVSGDDTLSLILYSMNLKKGTSDVLFKKVEIEYSPLIDSLEKVSQDDTYTPSEVFLSTGQRYIVETPILHSNLMYRYKGDDNIGLLWHPSLSSASSEEEMLFEVSEKEGMYQEIRDKFLNQDVNLFETEENDEYLLYWDGENISNIPANLCLVYNTEEKCWYQDMFSAGIREKNIRFFTADKETKLMTLIYGSTSYNLPTQNLLREVLLMRYPVAWNDILYKSENPSQFIEIEAQNISTSPHSTFYRMDPEGIQENSLLSIPQASDPGWLAIGRKGNTTDILGKSKEIILNGWKQGWDISDTSYDSIFIFYWPNLLSYFGYGIILIVSGYFVFKLFRERKYVK